MSSDATHEPAYVSPVGAPPDEHATIYETAEISEGHAPAPRWFMLVLLALFAFAGWYIATQWSAQTSSAQNLR